MPRKRRSSPAELKANVALEALREAAPMTELASRYDGHPNLIAPWKRSAREQVLASFAGKHAYPEAAREAEIKAWRAKGGELVIDGLFCPRPSVVEPRPEGHDGRFRPRRAQPHMPVSPGIDRPLVVVRRGHGREPAESAAAAAH